MKRRQKGGHYLAAFWNYLTNLGFDSKTLQNYRSDVTSFIEWFVENCGRDFSPDAITDEHLKGFCARLLQEGLRPATVRRKLTGMRAFLLWAEASGLATRVPRGPKLGPVRREPPHVLTREEQDALVRVLEQFATPRDVALVLILLDTGMGLGELLQVTGRDVEQGPGETVLAVRGGKQKPRRVSLTDRAARALGRYLESSPVRADEPIFRGRKGPLGPRAVQHLLAHYANLCGLAGKVNAATLRRTFVANALAQGRAPAEVAAQLGIAERSLRCLLAGREEWVHR